MQRGACQGAGWQAERGTRVIIRRGVRGLWMAQPLQGLRQPQPVHPPMQRAHRCCRGCSGWASPGVMREGC